MYANNKIEIRVSGVTHSLKKELSLIVEQKQKALGTKRYSLSDLVIEVLEDYVRKSYEMLLKMGILRRFERSRGHIRLCLISSGFRGIEKTSAECPPYAHGKNLCFLGLSIFDCRK